MVQPTPYGGGVSPVGYGQQAVDPYDLLEGGKRAIKFVTKDADGFDKHAPVGTSFTGLIVGDLRSMQVTDFETKEPKFYKDNRPVMQVVLDLQTDERDPEDPTDDGIRALYVKNQMLAAFQQALTPTRHLGRIGEGTRVTVTLVGYKPTGKGNPQKLYAVQIGPEFVPYVPPEARQTADAVYGGQAPQQGMQFVPAAQPQPPVQQVQQYPQPVAPQPAPYVPPQLAQPVAPQAPQPPVQQVQQYPQPVAPQPVSPALAALNAIADTPALTAQDVAQAAPAAPADGITDEILTAYQTLIQNSIDPHTAINSLAQRLAPGNEAGFTQALAARVGVQVPATA